ncbi:MAG: hypothetical protein ACJ73S_09325 [Mycobacteriales bacterium]
MRASSRITTATIVACLALAGCGGHKNKTAKVHLNKDTPSASKSPAAATDAFSGGPSFNYPSDVHIQISWHRTGDATKDKILSDYAIALRAVLFAATNPQHPDGTWARYATGRGITDYNAYLAKLNSKGVTVSGTQRYRGAIVTNVQGNNASVTQCEDDTELLDKNIKTGKTVPGSTSSAATYTINASFLLENGTWKVTGTNGVQGSC